MHLCPLSPAMPFSCHPPLADSCSSASSRAITPCSSDLAAVAVLGSLCFYYCCLRVSPAHKEAAARGHKRLGAGKVRADHTPLPPRAGSSQQHGQQSPSASHTGLCSVSPAVGTPSLEEAVTEMTAAVARL